MVEIYDDRVSIVSPGGVPKGITKENFGKRSIARNPIIADLLRRAHYIEKAGTGIGRMRELMEDAGLKEPEFQYDDFFEVSFLRPSYYDNNYGTYDLSKKDNEKITKLNNTQTQIINLIRDNPSINVKDERFLFDLIQRSFTQRRKTLSNCLLNYGFAKKKQDVEQMWKTLGMNSNVRGESLNLEQFAQIADYLKNMQ